MEEAAASDPAGWADPQVSETHHPAHLAALLDPSQDAIVTCSLDHRISFWSAGSEALYGWSREEAAGCDVHERLGTSFPAPLAELEKVLFEAGRWNGQLVRKRRDGREVVVAVRWAVRRDAAGAPIEILETGRDVTDEVAAKDELQKSEFRYRNMFQAMAVSFWELDFSGVGALLRAWKKAGVTDLRRYLGDHRDLVREAMKATRVLDVNEKTVHLFRAESREALLGSVAPYWPPQSEGVYAESVIAAVSGAPYFESEAEFRAADGHIFESLFTVSFPKGAVGRGTILVGIIDMTERNHAQETLAKVQAELAHATRVTTLGELTASIAHEVNQPLAAIVTNGEAGLRWLNREAPDLAEVQKVLGRVISDGKRAAQVLSRIRGMATKAAPQRGPVCLNEVVGDAVALTRREVSRHGIALRIELATELPKVEADRVQLQQVLINLLINGVQAMSQVESARALSVRTAIDEGRVLVDVEDSGPGIAPEDAKRLFQAFFTTKATGMGIGLSICKGIVDAHGGRIWAAPKESPGALFKLSFPAIGVHPS